MIMVLCTTKRRGHYSCAITKTPVGTAKARSCANGIKSGGVGEYYIVVRGINNESEICYVGGTNLGGDVATSQAHKQSGE